MTTPERAAKVIHDGVKAGRSRILVGPDAYLFDFLGPHDADALLLGAGRPQAIAQRVSPPPADA